MKRFALPILLGLCLAAIFVFVAFPRKANAPKEIEEVAVNAPVPPTGGVRFGEVTSIAVGLSVTYADGLQVSLDKIDDSRCKPDVQCVWAGELAPTFHINGGLAGDVIQEVRLGAVTQRGVEVAGYSFMLRDATEGSIDLLVDVVKPQNESKDDLIRVFSPDPKTPTLVTSPLVIKGEARGTWYFEASFPVKLLDEKDQVVAVGHAEAGSDWMTNDFVPFTATLTFEAPATELGVLILQKDNPSGIPEKDDELRVPVRFTPPPL